LEENLSEIKKELGKKANNISQDAKDVCINQNIPLLPK
jgi:hypothetical protein